MGEMLKVWVTVSPSNRVRLWGNEERARANAEANGRQLHEIEVPAWQEPRWVPEVGDRFQFYPDDLDIYRRLRPCPWDGQHVAVREGHWQLLRIDYENPAHTFHKVADDG